jgi:L-lysine exporter family protein LysE/ArgO
LFTNFITGFVGGALLCCTFGVVFFAMIQNSIDNGYWSGVKISIGGILSDIMLIILALFGTSFLPPIEHFDMYLCGFGAVFLSGMGIASFFKKSPKLVYPSTKVGNLLYYLGLGFTINSINPMNFIFWGAAATAIKNLDQFNTFLFFAGSMLGVFVTQFIMCYYAHYLQRYFTPNIIIWINRCSGIAFIGWGIYLGTIVFKFLFS